MKAPEKRGKKLTRNEARLRCSFCYAPRRKVRFFITGPRCRICDACLLVASSLIIDRNRARQSDGSTGSTP